MSDEISFAKLCGVIREHREPDFDKTILAGQHGINYQIPNTDFFKLHRPESIGCTALHLAFNVENKKVFNALLEAGTDFTARNQKNMTVVHRAVEDKFQELEILKLVDRFRKYGSNFTLDDVYSYYIMQQVIDEKRFKEYSNWRLRGKLENSFVDSVFSTQIKTGNPANPCSDNEISHLHAACMINNSEAVEFFLNNGVDVNQAVNVDSPIFSGFTPLHFAIWYSGVKTAKVLLKFEADLYLKNGAGLTPLEMLLDLNMKILEWMHIKGKLPYDNAMVDYFNSERILNAIMEKLEDSTDLFVLCVACTMKNKFWAEKLLDKITNVNEALKADSVWPGWTALHYAAFFNNTEIIKLLLSKGADIEAKNENCITPFDMLISKASLQDIVYILSTKPSWKNILLSDGKTLLTDVMVAMQMIDINDEKYKDVDVYEIDPFEDLLEEVDVNAFVPVDSPLWPGYTILHLAVMFSEKLTILNDFSDLSETNYKEKYEERRDKQEDYYLQNIEICLKKNANVNIQDVHGRTPIHQTFRQRESKAVDILLRDGKRILNMIDEDNLSILHIACTKKNHRVLKRLLEDRNHLNLSVLPNFKWETQFYDNVVEEILKIGGSTALHIAVANEDVWVTLKLLKRGPDLNAKDAHGLTPIHRAFAFHKIWQLGNALYRKRDPKEYPLEYMDKYIDPKNIANYDQVSKFLADNCNALLSSSNLRDSIVDNIGLSYLHIACFEDNIAACEKLLRQGLNVNTSLEIREALDLKHPLFFLRHMSGYTPLQISLHCKQELEDMLLLRGADIFQKSANGRSLMFEKISQRNRYIDPINIKIDISLMYEDETARKRLWDEYGWTILHVACKLEDFEMAEESLKCGIDVNTRISKDAAVDPNCTPLHILMMKGLCAKRQERPSAAFDRILQLLLDNNADVSLPDSKGKTPLHLSEYFSSHEEQCHRLRYKGLYLVDKVLKYLKDFKTNPIDEQGISIFHIACIKQNLEIMEKFLQNRVDVNQPVNLYANVYAGYSPLHLVVKSTSILSGDEGVARQMQAVGLLLKYGADVHVKNVLDNTLFHETVQNHTPVMALLEKFLEAGVNINLRNVYGKTAFQELWQKGDIEQTNFFIKNGFEATAINSVTEEIEIPEFVLNNLGSNDYDELFLKLTGHPSITGFNEMGLSAIHLIASTPDKSNTIHAFPAIEYLLKQGVDIDHQDKLGRTALHRAAQFRKWLGVEFLLKFGANFNIIDSYRKTAFSYAVDPIKFSDEQFYINYCGVSMTVIPFIRCFYEMDRRGLNVNDINKQLFSQSIGKFTQTDELISWLNWRKEQKIGSTSLKLADFWSETGAIVDYPKMSKEDRDEIKNFFEDKAMNMKDILDFGILFEIQYRKALARSELVERAKDSLDIVLGFCLPYVCYDILQKFLSNDDLKNLIKAAECK